MDTTVTYASLNGAQPLSMTPPADFPDRPYADMGEYLEDYVRSTTFAWRSVDPVALSEAGQALLRAYTSDNQVFVCGNGGSAAISDHLECDHMKGVHMGTDLGPRVRSLASNNAVLTAVANDISYDEIFSFPLARLSRPNDVLLTISSSGNSANIVKALEYGSGNGLTTIAMTGFDGGRASRIADISVHVNARNYGIVEDVHQGLMHVLAQFIRQTRLSHELIAGVHF